MFLADDALIVILSFMTPKEVLRSCALVSRQWHQCSRDNLLWFELVAHAFRIDPAAASSLHSFCQKWFPPPPPLSFSKHTSTTSAPITIRQQQHHHKRFNSSASASSPSKSWLDSTFPTLADLSSPRSSPFKVPEDWLSAYRRLVHEVCPSRQVCHLADAHSNEVWHLQWSHAGDRLASASKDHTVCIWKFDASSLRLSLSRKLVHEAPVAWVCWSRDDQLILCTTNEEQVAMWDSVSGELINSFQTKLYDCYGKFVPLSVEALEDQNRNLLLPQSTSSTTTTPTTESQEDDQSPRSGNSSNTNLPIPIADVLSASPPDSDLPISSLDEFSVLDSVSDMDDVMSTSDQQSLASQAMDISDERQDAIMIGSSYHYSWSVPCPSWLDDELQFVRDHLNPYVKDLVSKHELQVLRPDGSIILRRKFLFKGGGYIHCLTPTPDGRKVVFACGTIPAQSHQLVVADLVDCPHFSDTDCRTINEDGAIIGFTISSDSRFVVVMVRQFQQPLEIALKTVHSNREWRSYADPAVYKQFRVRIYDLDTLQLLREFSGPQAITPNSQTNSIFASWPTFGSDGQDRDALVCTGSENGKLHVFHWKLGAVISEMKAHDNVVNAVQFHPHIPGLLATASDDRSIKLFGSPALYNRQFQHGLSKILSSTFARSPRSASSPPFDRAPSALFC